MTLFNSVLVANRGEIACRVLRTARAQGYRTVAVYSEADARSPHVDLADDAICIGAGPAVDSYLSIDNILAAAKDTGAEAIHPGYGFLSENADFAQACIDNGLVFIGPSPQAIGLMGNKAEAKRRMIAAGVPCVPGYSGEAQSTADLLEASKTISLPIMVKAAAGGGGRGMRLVRRAEELPNAIELARTEALSAFGSPELILEHAVECPRHVEVQVFGDQHGNLIHLGERDCSVQRRHQKVIEEAPCPIMTPELRQAMGAAAVAAAASINYYGAGTVEFLLDSSGNFYFLEMNTRLQVEHPVTECITGLDLVAMQLKVAQGHVLDLKQEDITLNGHAIEVRLYCENPAEDFLPASGPIDAWQPPQGTGIRVDAGIRSEQILSTYYDPMVAKIIANGPDRETARTRLVNALHQTRLAGIANNREFLIACLENTTFIEGKATTAFIDDHLSKEALQSPVPSFTDSAIAAVIEHSLEYQKHHESSLLVSQELKDWSSAAHLLSRRRYQFNESTRYDLCIMALGHSRYRVFDDEQEVLVALHELGANSVRLSADQVPHTIKWHQNAAGQLHLQSHRLSATFEDQITRDGADHEAETSGSVVAPMHGQLLEIRVQLADMVKKGQTLAVLEAMKMHYEIIANADGTVKAIMAANGEQVAADQVLIDIEPSEAED